MRITKVDINVTEEDIKISLGRLCDTTQSEKVKKDIENLLGELIINSTQGATMFFQIMFGKGLPEIFNKNDVIRCKWERLNIGLNDADNIYKSLQENNLINLNEEVHCWIEEFNGYTSYFAYRVKFKYGENKFETVSMGFEDIIT
jgi:hypothetical protein